MGWLSSDLNLSESSFKEIISKPDCIRSGLVTQWMRVRLIGENLKGQKAAAEAACWAAK